MVVAIVVDLLNFKAIKLAFYRFASHVFQRIRRCEEDFAVVVDVVARVSIFARQCRKSKVK